MTGSSVLRVLIVRHGETAQNKQRILQGHLDTHLNTHGTEQTVLAGRRIKEFVNHQLDAVWSSDLTRCKQTTTNMLKSAGLDGAAPVVYMRDLRERHMGEIEGMRVEDAVEFARKHGKNYRDYGESHRAAVYRLNAAFDSIVAQSLEKGHDTVMIVSHGGVIAKFIKHLISDKGVLFSDRIKDDDVRVPHNTSFTVVDIEKSSGKGIVQYFGDASHLSNHSAVAEQAEQ